VDSSDYVDPSDLAGMSRSGDLITKMGYDREAVMADPSLRAELMQKVAGPYSATAPAQQSATPPPQIPNPKSPNGNDISAPPGAPRLINRQQPTIPAPPPRPLPDTLSGAPAPTPQSMAGATPPTSSAVSPSGTPTPSVETTNSRQAVGNLLAPEPDLPDTAKEDAMIAAKSMPINPRQPIYKEGTPGKVGRGFKAAVEGFLEHGVPGAVAGAVDPAIVGAKPYGAPNSGYDIDDQTRQAQLGLANKQRADAIAAFKEKSDLRKQQDAASKDAGEISNTAAKLPNETTTANADMLKAQDAGNPKNEQEAIAAYGRETDPAKKAALWDTVTRMHTATMSERPPKSPGEHPSAELQMLNDWKTAFQRDNKRPPNAQEIQSYRDKQGSTSFSEGSGLTGEEFLKTLPPAQQNRVKAMANGDIPPPSPSNRGPEAQALLNAIQNYDPSYTEARYKAKQQFKNGKDSTSVLQLATALKHADNALSHSANVGFAPLLNEDATKSDAAYNKDVQYLTGEVGKLITGSALTVDEGKRLTSGLNSVRQGVRDEAIKESLDLLGGKVSGILQKYKTAVGADLPVDEYFDKDTQERLARYGVIDHVEGKNSSQKSSPKRPDSVPANAVWNQEGNGGKGSWRMP
jgi:hypothetical protein